MSNGSELVGATVPFSQCLLWQLAVNLHLLLCILSPIWCASWLSFFLASLKSRPILLLDVYCSWVEGGLLWRYEKLD